MPSFLERLARTVPQLQTALAAQESGDLARARAAYLELADQPQLTAISLHQLGAIADQQGDTARAAALFQTAVRLDPQRPIFHQSLATAMERLGKRAAALEAMMSFAFALNSTGESDLAIAAYRRILEIDANRYDACLNLGALLVNKGMREGIAHLVKGIALCALRQPRMRRLIDALSPRLVAQGLVTEAVAATAGIALAECRLLELGLTNLGVALGDRGLVEEAMACHRLALAIEPGCADAHFNQSLLLLGAGEYAAGWPEYEWRWRWSHSPEPHRRLVSSRWEGQDLDAKTVLVFAEQGWGDAMQFVPLIRRLSAAGLVVLEVGEPLLALIRANFQGGNVEVVLRPKDLDRVGTGPPLDYAVALMSLPDRIGLTVADLPVATNYLQADPAKAVLWRECLGASPGIKIGIAWAGSPTHKNDRNRSVALASLGALFALPGLSWHSLQVGARAGEPAQLGLPLRDLAAELNDFADTAAVIANLDLVISVDTAVAHLAAAMGKPCWVLLPSPADWRWLKERSDSPWYPSVRLFRQPRDGDWESVAASVAQALRGLVSAT
jgi:tetratricopeptide (TPR) repeat protein